MEKKLDIVVGPYHKYHNVGLPQFTEPIPKDINEELGLDRIDAKNTKIIYSTASEIPEELKDVPVEIDESIGDPYYLREKTHVSPKRNYRLGMRLKNSYKSLRRYKVHRA